jgi:hypothetical protein
MNTLPIELLEEVIAHLVCSDTVRKISQEDDHQPQNDGSIFSPPIPGTETSRPVKKPWKFTLKSFFRGLKRVRIVRKWSSRDPVADQQHDNIFNIRLTCRRLNEASSRMFFQHVQMHPWKLESTSLMRLAHLLGNNDLVRNITHLRLNSYRISLHDQGNDFSAAASERNTAARSSYIISRLRDDLTAIFELAKNLAAITVTPEIVYMEQNDPIFCEEALQIRPLTEEMYFLKKYFDIPNPMLQVQEALEATGLNEKLEHMTVYTHCDMDFFNIPMETPLPKTLVCNNITRLTVDPIYLMDEEFRIECPNLQTLIMFNTGRLPRWRMNMLHQRLYDMPDHERQRRSDMLGNLRHIVFTDGRAPNSQKRGFIYLFSIYSAISYIAKFTRRIECMTIRHADLYNDLFLYAKMQANAALWAGGALEDDIQDVVDFKIGVLRLEEIVWLDHEEDENSGVKKGVRRLYGADEMWRTLKQIHKYVEEFEVSSDPELEAC